MVSFVSQRRRMASSVCVDHGRASQAKALSEACIELERSLVADPYQIDNL